MRCALCYPRSQKRLGELTAVEDKLVEGRVKVPILDDDDVTLVGGAKCGFAQ